jgi:hypothetical protein
MINKEIRYRLFIKGLSKNIIAALFRFQNLNLSEDSSFSNFIKLKEHAIRMAITEQKLNEFINDNRSQRKEISELINTLDKTIE